MLKHEELTNHDSCMNRARMFEMTFVLLGRDMAASAAIRAWCTARVATGKNEMTDPQIKEAIACAERMERECAMQERLKRLVGAGQRDVAYDVLIEFYRVENERSGTKLDQHIWTAMCVDAKLAVERMVASNAAQS